MANDAKTGVKKPFFGATRRLEEDIAHITGEMYKRNVELAETNKTLALLQKIDELFLLTPGSVEFLGEKICQAITEVSAHSYLGIYKIHAAGYLEHIASVLDARAQMRALEDIVVPHEWAKHGGSSLTVPLKHHKTVKRLYVQRLRSRGSTAMALVVGYPDGDSDHVPEHDKVLFERLSDTVGVVIEGKILAEQNEHVLLQLKKSNDKLKALDEAKDEFISMASHQLRTPLTSIKGYLSMVLEGDVGEVSSQQKEMLNQAFVSSQRMVYLIADLLNVSRMQTGKFVIELKDTYLPDVIEAELAQLKETVKARGLTLEFNKPESFPTLQLDETKIRQVIMNFVDNAVYYTPAGGAITITLVEKPKSIEYLVHDTGIGVPKALQHKLFTKFYRAENAQKARPDGTGLGLYMAKKVIIASGGAIIFKSKEGMGSTFGFTFPKG